MAREGVATLVAAAAQLGVQLVAPAREAAKHDVLVPFAEEGDIGTIARSCDAAIVLAGDGTLLHLAAQLLDGPPLLGVNYGMVGYLSGAGRDRVTHAVERLVEGNFQTVELGVLEARLGGGGKVIALNDIVASGGVTGRVIQVSWRVLPASGVPPIEMGTIPCDGMVVATPVGSTAYNLSNGGPVMAWGVEGHVVSFIAPHTLAARPLVVAPGDSIEITHMGRGAPLKLFADGRKAGVLESNEHLTVGPGPGRARLVMLDDITFYERYRDNFAATVLSSDAGPAGQRPPDRQVHS